MAHWLALSYYRRKLGYSTNMENKQNNKQERAEVPTLSKGLNSLLTPWRQQESEQTLGEKDPTDSQISP